LREEKPRNPEGTRSSILEPVFHEGNTLAHVDIP
jgi:hypothetical protein